MPKPATPNLTLARISIGASALSILSAVSAHAQQRIFYGSDGRVVGRTTTDTQGSTTGCDAAGRVTARTATTGNTTTVYDAGGRAIGKIDREKKW
jgi:YD repeat-containing protein